MIFNEQTARQVANSLLQIKAVKLNPNQPFTWASGLKSPIYCDNRKALSYPDIREFIRNELTQAVLEHYRGAEVIAGVATAGIPQGVLVAQELKLPFIYVRSSKKSHGMTNRIEGELPVKSPVVVIEDLISTGKSSLNAVHALREADATVLGMVAIFTYGLPVADKNFREAGCPLVTLSNYDILIEEAVKGNYITQDDIKSLMTWRKDPQTWSDARQNI
ncbi:MAG: orotate phosphoribosyltransferase [Chlorobi bacterium]|nr:orotate phosphoribosyltransferase [Chlorobiota bacterium]